MNKKINYLARSFDDIKSELLKFSKEYYPEISQNFNDASIGSWFIDLVSAVGDDLSYHTDRMYQENNINTSASRETMFNFARLNGIHIPGPKASMCEIELSCEIPANTEDISQPNWSYAPIIKNGSIVGNPLYQFQTTEDVNFGEQFNSKGISNRKFFPKKNSNGAIVSYIVSKTTIAINGKKKIFKVELGPYDVKPFMEIILPEKNILNIESIICKDGINFQDSPEMYEFYINEEQFKFEKDNVDTYKFFEVDSLSDQYIFTDNYGDNKYVFERKNGYEMNESYEDYTESSLKKAPENVEEATEGVYYYRITNDKTEVVMKKKDKDDSFKYIIMPNEILYNSQRTTRYYKGKWKPITQKYITEYLENGYMKITFGSGTKPIELDDANNYTEYGKHVLTKIVNNDLLGTLPKIGWTVYILYTVGGGSETNLSQGAINNIIHLDYNFIKNNIGDYEKNNIIKSFKVVNLSPSIGGRDMLNNDELRNYIKYAYQEQKRCITLNDYKSRLAMMPAKYGNPFRFNVIEENNKISISCLGLNANGKLDDGLHEIMKDNMIEYLSHFKSLGDYVEFKSGKIYNIGFEIDVVINKEYNVAEVVKKIASEITSYVSVEKRQMGENIYIGKLNKLIIDIDGVINLIELRVYSLYNGGEYSSSALPLPKYIKNGEEETFKTLSSITESYRIDLNKIDNVLICDNNSMFEILNPKNDIVVRTKIK